MNNGKVYNKSKGNLGEALAVKFLEQRGFRILDRNHRNLHGEIDIIAKRADMIHFVEVKYRTNTNYGHGREAVTSQKQKTIRRTAMLYLLNKSIYTDIVCCFDVIEIQEVACNSDLYCLSNYRIEHLENCFM